MTVGMSSRNAPQKAMQATDAPLETPDPIVLVQENLKSGPQSASQSKMKLEEKTMINVCKQRPLKDEVLSRETSTGKEERKEMKTKIPAQHVDIQQLNLAKGETADNILEKGIIYFFFQPRVNIEEPHDLADVARSYFVLRPVLPGHEFGNHKACMETDAGCRLMVFPKKRFPNSGKERDMGFVEDVGHSMRYLQGRFLSKETYKTSTRGERTKQAAKLYAEGVYAIQSTRHKSYLVYVLTIPTEIGNTQRRFGLREHGKWIVQSKNPEYPSPPYARLTKDPEYPGL